MHINEKEFKLAEFKRFHEGIDVFLPFEHEELNSFISDYIIMEDGERYSVISSWTIYETLEKERKNTNDEEKLQFFAKVEEQLFASGKCAFTNDW